MNAEVKEQRLAALLRGYGEALVAFSGGVDSTYLLAVAHEVLGARATAVTADSPSLARTTLAEAVAFCRDRGIAHEVLATHELEQPEYVANDGLRCFHCKSALLEAMGALRRARGGDAALLVGAIAEDFDDVRPGLKAAAEAGARWPLAEAGFRKEDVRERSRARDLPTWDRPAEPCLSSRVPYGEPVTADVLSMIERAEVVLRGEGLRECRARHHRIGGRRGALCRIEVPLADLPRVLERREVIVRELRLIGYANVALDLAGLASGGFNALLTRQELKLVR